MKPTQEMQAPLRELMGGLDYLAMIAYIPGQAEVFPHEFAHTKTVPRHETVTRFSAWIGNMLLECEREPDSSLHKVSIQEKARTIHPVDGYVIETPIGAKHTITIKSDSGAEMVHDIRGYSTGSGKKSPRGAYHRAESLNAQKLTGMLHIFNEYVADLREQKHS